MLPVDEPHILDVFAEGPQLLLCGLVSNVPHHKGFVIQRLCNHKGHKYANLALWRVHLAFQHRSDHGPKPANCLNNMEMQWEHALTVERKRTKGFVMCQMHWSLIIDSSDNKCLILYIIVMYIYDCRMNKNVLKTITYYFQLTLACLGLSQAALLCTDIRNNRY